MLQFKRGKVKREGVGLSFIYSVPTSTIVAIPVASADVPFVFQEATADFQSVTIQGQLTYRVADPKRLATLLDFSVDQRRTYCSDDPRKLPERLVHTMQTLTRAVTQRMVLRDVLVSSDAIVEEVLAKLKTSEAVTTLGVEILSDLADAGFCLHDSGDGSARLVRFEWQQHAIEPLWLWIHGNNRLVANVLRGVRDQSILPQGYDQAEVTLNDGQRLRAFNDLFIGARSQVSAQYRIACNKKSEVQTSSGVLLSTGAGSTGWVSSVFNMAAGLAKFCGGSPGKAVRLPWEDRRLIYMVREPVSQSSFPGSNRCRDAVSG